VSGALRDEIEGALRQEGIERSFKHVITAEDVERGKPDPEGYVLAMTAINGEPPLPSRLIHPHECVAIEDSPAGIEAAAAAGLRTVGVAQTYNADALGNADLVVESLEGMSLTNLRNLLKEAV
jgi:beta-phosphoglucomutase